MESKPIDSSQYEFDQKISGEEDKTGGKQVLAPNSAENPDNVNEEMEVVCDDDDSRAINSKGPIQDEGSKRSEQITEASNVVGKEHMNEAHGGENEIDENVVETSFDYAQIDATEEKLIVPTEEQTVSDEDDEDGRNTNSQEHNVSVPAAQSSVFDGNGLALYSSMSAKTAETSSRLCEQLRLTFEPTLTTKFCGDYRTGKRINMRKIIPYIASSFKKDKIWLRRKKPSKREYQIAIVIDDSNSMAYSQSNAVSPGTVACEALVMLANAMTRLEVGDIAVASFGETTKFLHSFETPFSVTAAASILEQFEFKQQSSPMTECIKSVYEHFLEAQKLRGTKMVEYQQISFVVTDAIFDDDAREKVPNWIRKAMECHQLIVMIMIDKEGEGTRTGVASIKRVKYIKGKPTLVHYLENYPFPYYIIVQDVESIPEVLSDALRQWFQMLNQD